MTRFKVWGNVSYLIPAALAMYWHLWLTAILCFVVAGFSTLFHLSGEKRFSLPDTIFSWLLILSNLGLCYLGNFQAPYFWVAVLFLALALLYRYRPWTRREYSFNHGLWHLYGALITLFCIFTYVL
jgi:hypothetical protein